MNALANSPEFWRARLYVPNYRISEAARYAHISPQTVSNWHQPRSTNRRGTLSNKDKGQALSYLQLIEVAVVSRFRKAGISLAKIRAAREYVSKQLEAEFPFAEYRFKTDGRDLWMDYAEIEAEMGDKKLLSASQGGQLAWADIIGRLQEFDYENDLAVRWHVAGKGSKVVIDPKIQFGAPSVDGIATWVFRGRLEAGESFDEIREDFGVSASSLRAALEFEGVDLGRETRH